MELRLTGLLGELDSVSPANRWPERILWFRGYKRLVAPSRLFRLLADAVGKQKRDRFHDPSSDLNDQVPLI